ncbi:hypothetical protein [Paenibacillus sp. GCM10027626]|uniref:hypothetical protein n=1 Tax=Paenibacillus sp. GCM10027626 TaxID=3273411 RepID=UPI003644DA9F
MRTGTTAYSFDVVENWPKWPDSVTAGYTHGVDKDAAGRIYVFHTGKPSVVIFDEEGHFLNAWGEQFEGGAHGFYLHSEGGSEFIYLTDTSKGVVAKYTLDGQEVLTIGTPDLPDIYDEQRRFVPTDVAVGPNGDIYVADGYGQSYIHRYTASGEYISSWGGAGDAPGRMTCPHGISVNLRGEEPELYVADRGNNRIQVFTLDGEHKRFITQDMDMPCSFYFVGDELYFPDLHSRVTIFDKHDRLVAHLGEDQQAYKQEGWPNLPEQYFRADRFSSPHGVCADSEGNVYVAEWTVNGRVTKLTRSK